MLGPEANHYISSRTRRTSSGARPLPRPDRADGRRPADDRRGLPPPLAADHAARLPPRAARQAGRHDRRGDRRRARRAGAGRPSTSTPGRAGWRCGSRCARCSASTPTRDGARDRRRRAVRGGARVLASDYCCRCCAGRGTPWRACSAAARARHADLRRDRRAGERAASAARTSSALLLDADDEDGSTLVRRGRSATRS